MVDALLAGARLPEGADYVRSSLRSWTPRSPSRSWRPFVAPPGTRGRQREFDCAVSAVAVAPRRGGRRRDTIIRPGTGGRDHPRPDEQCAPSIRPTPLGNLIVVSVFWDNTSSVSVADSRGNAYTSGGARRTWGSNRSAQVFYARSVAAGTNTVTATFIKAIRVTATVHVQEYRGRRPNRRRGRDRGGRRLGHDAAARGQRQPRARETSCSRPAPRRGR